MIVLGGGRAWVDEAPGTARSDAEGLFVTGAEAADSKDHSHRDKGHGGRKNHIQPDVEVRTLGNATHLGKLK